MTTPVEIINLALKQAGVLGVGQTATPEDVADAFKLLNMMLAQWSVKRSIVFRIADIACVSTGAATYTVGPGGSFNTPRPSKIVGVYGRQLTPPQFPTDFPMELIQSQTDWGRIGNKTIVSMPNAAFYDPQQPLGVLYVWPIAPTGYEIHIQVLVPLTQFATPYDNITLPAEYEEALMYNLAGRLCILYQIPLPQGLPQLATGTLQTLRQANSQVGKLYMPDALLANAGYNFYTDR